MELCGEIDLSFGNQHFAVKEVGRHSGYMAGDRVKPAHPNVFAAC